MAITRYCKVGIESSFGAGSTNMLPVSVNSVSPKIDRGLMTDEVICSYFAGDAEGGALKCGGSIELTVRAESIGEFLYALFGKVTTTSEGGGLYKHIFELDNPKSS